ncbi:MAG: alpha/beta hydrolase [Candidatus Izimaplasma sp.]|nr:alpha/beta hydrolase [Candidatus Izimaplasma bacterium]
MEERLKVSGKNDCPLDTIKRVPKKPKAIVQIFHGMGEHKERYLPFIKFLYNNGYGVYIHDHRKHGKSLNNEAELGIFTKYDLWQDVLDDCYFISRRILKENPGVPIVIMGHSMGSIIARSFLTRYRTVAKKAIIMGTLPPYNFLKAMVPLNIARLVGVFKGNKRSDFLAKLLNQPLLKKYDNPESPFEWLTHDEAVVKAYEADPLCGYSYNPRFYSEFFKAIIEVNSSKVFSLTKDIPLLFISGSEDPVGDYGEGVEKVISLYRGHGMTEINTLFVDNARHEVLNEIDKAKTYQAILDWLNNS